jgi:hypothetical protein
MSEIYRTHVTSSIHFCVWKILLKMPWQILRDNYASKQTYGNMEANYLSI